ncbi:MAG: hypothetical protein LCH61_08100 [Proteobacteria bacterium]|nr:hypothetical protein [Pseudomonadota bacterium]
MRSVLLTLAIVAPAADALAQSYEFVSAPHQGLNRIYRVNRQTGEVGACQFGLKDGAVGVTICYPAGEGAKGPAPGTAPGDFGLVASHHLSEAGIFRIDRQSGEMSVCYVQNDREVVCTSPAK